MYTCKVNKCYENKRLNYYIFYNYYNKYFVGKIVYTFFIQNLNDSLYLIVDKKHDEILKND